MITAVPRSSPSDCVHYLNNSNKTIFRPNLIAAVEG